MGLLKPRTNLDRSLYRVPLAVQRTYLRMAKSLFYACGFGLAIAALGHLTQMPWIGTLGYVIAVLGAGYGFQCWFMIKVLSKKRLDVSDDVITYDHGNGKVEIYQMADVEHVKLTWIPLLYSRLALHMKDGRVLKFNNAMWERFDYVMDVVAGAHPELTAFPRYAKFRNMCIAFDHYRSRMSESMTLAAFYDLFAKAVAAPVVAGALVLSMKAIGIGRDVFPPNDWVFANTFIFVAILWPIWMGILDLAVFRSTIDRLEKDSTQVRRDRLAEEKFDHSYGRHSWIAYAALIGMTCLMCAIRLT